MAAPHVPPQLILRIFLLRHSLADYIVKSADTCRLRKYSPYGILHDENRLNQRVYWESIARPPDHSIAVERGNCDGLGGFRIAGRCVHL